MKKVTFTRKSLEREYLGLSVKIIILDVLETEITTDNISGINLIRHIWYQPYVEERVI